MSLLKTIRIYDPALDWAAKTKLLDWAVERDVEKAELVPGKRPRVYHFQRLTRSQLLFVEKADHEVTARDRAFALGVRRIDMEDGTSWEPIGVGRADFAAISEAELDTLEPCDIQDVGGVVLTKSRVPFGFPVSLPVPPSSRAVLEGALSRYAERSQTDAPQTKSGPAAPSDS